MLKKTLFSILFFWSQVCLFAHPHMFFSNRYYVEETNGVISGIKVEWIFDKYFSQEIAMDFDLDRDGKFDSQETQEVHDYAFSNLAKYGYMQFIRQGETQYEVETISDFTVLLKDNILIYQFHIDLQDLPEGDLWLATFDPTFFCAIKYTEDDPVVLPQNSRLKYAMEENPDRPVYYDPFGPPNISPIYKKWEPGLNTFIPTEVHLRYE